jgi:hypothetical protein
MTSETKALQKESVCLPSSQICGEERPLMNLLLEATYVIKEQVDLRLWKR